MHALSYLHAFNLSMHVWVRALYVSQVPAYLASLPPSIDLIVLPWKEFGSSGMRMHPVSTITSFRRRKQARITSHHITSHHITSHHITSHHITSHHITSHSNTSQRHHITSHNGSRRVPTSSHERFRSSHSFGGLPCSRLTQRAGRSSNGSSKGPSNKTRAEWWRTFTASRGPCLPSRQMGSLFVTQRAATVASRRSSARPSSCV